MFILYVMSDIVSHTVSHTRKYIVDGRSIFTTDL